MGLRSLGMVLAAALLLSSCTGSTEDTHGQVHVTVTLSRQGALGPNLHHVAQPGKTVIVVNATGERAEEDTDSDGVAHFEVTPGDYQVSTEFCPERPKHVTVTKGATVHVRIDCIAA